jgi:hypothetical protein
MSDSDAITEVVLKDLVSYIGKGQCILFLGAGIHAAPPRGSASDYPRAKRPPMGGELAQLLSQECGFDQPLPDEPSSDLMRVALRYELARSRKSLVESLRRYLLEGKEPSPVLKAVAQLPFPIFVTTNYDRFLEDTLQRVANKHPTVRVYSKESREPTKDYPGEPAEEQPLLFKMHGDLSDPATIVITDEDYITFVQRMSDRDLYHPVPETIRYWIRKWPTLFIGYSLGDFNLRLLWRTLRWRVDASALPQTYIVDPRPDPDVRKSWSVGTPPRYIAQDLWEFIPWLYKEINGQAFVL